MTDILLIAATGAELCGHEGVVCGIGPVEAAAATARALALGHTGAVLQVGVAGGMGLDAGSLVIGSESLYLDLAAAVPLVSRLEPDPRLLAAVARALPDAPLLPIATSAAVGAVRRDPASGLHVEAMEGFGVLRACALAGVPAVEVRAVSNEIGERDRSRWDIPRALAALAQALPALVASITEEKSASP